MLKIKELRLEKGWTQKELAERIKTTNKNVWAWENAIACPDIDTLIRISSIFEVSVDYLIGNSDDFGNVGANAAPADETLSEEEKDLIKFYRGIGDVERRAVLRMVQSFYQQAQEDKTRKSI